MLSVTFMAGSTFAFACLLHVEGELAERHSNGKGNPVTIVLLMEKICML